MFERSPVEKPYLNRSDTSRREDKSIAVLGVELDGYVLFNLVPGHTQNTGSGFGTKEEPGHLL
jgi:hypothetical protein